MNRQDPDPEAVYVWVARLTGTQRAVAARADRGLAKSWVEKHLGRDGDWNRAGTKDRYDAGPDTGIVELVELPDVAGIVMCDPARYRQ